MSIHIPNRIYFRIGDVAEIIGEKPYVIRFWESEFPFVAPEKAASGQRVYRRAQIEALILVKHLLHVERYSIEGAKRKLTELRRNAKLKEAMLALVSSESQAIETTTEAPSKTGIKIGSLVSKDALPLEQSAAATAPIPVEALKEKLEDLLKMIRK